MAENAPRPTPPSGSVWQARYRVLGQSAVWKDYLVCEKLDGPDKGAKVILEKASFGTKFVEVTA